MVDIIKTIEIMVVMTGIVYNNYCNQDGLSRERI